MKLEEEDIVKYVNELRENVHYSESKPIDDIIGQIIKKTGHKYEEEDFNDDLSGISTYLGGYRYFIGFNSNHESYGPYYKRFTLAHELAHVSIPSHQDYLSNPGNFFKDKGKFFQADGKEKEADLFAINLLAPQKAVLKDIDNKKLSYKNLKLLKDKYGISLHAAAFRFINLTELPCSFIVFNSQGNIEYERRSSEFIDKFPRHKYLARKYNISVPQKSKAAKLLKKASSMDFRIRGKVELNEWYTGYRSKDSIKVKEESFYLGYNNLYVSLLTFPK